MRSINKHTINIRGLNIRTLNSSRLNYAPNSTAYGGYCKDGLIFQLDFVKGLDATAKTWLDLISREKKATISGTFATTDGLVLSSGASVVMPSVEGVSYVEVCKKVNDTFSTATSASLSTFSEVGSIYAVRAYSVAPSTEAKAKNAAIDENRYNIPDGAFCLSDGTPFCLADGTFFVNK